MDDWIEFGKSFREFEKQGLNITGTLIDVEAGQYLIGDINNLGGVCDDCTLVCREDKILRYKVVWEK